jgi:hypothetical protein
LSEIIQRYFTPPPLSEAADWRFQSFPKSGRHASESVVDILWIHWSTSIGIGGRHQSESLVDMHRNTQKRNQSSARCAIWIRKVSNPSINLPPTWQKNRFRPGRRGRSIPGIWRFIGCTQLRRKPSDSLPRYIDFRRSGCGIFALPSESRGNYLSRNIERSGICLSLGALLYTGVHKTVTVEWT